MHHVQVSAPRGPEEHGGRAGTSREMHGKGRVAARTVRFRFEDAPADPLAGGEAVEVLADELAGNGASVFSLEERRVERAHSPPPDPAPRCNAWMYRFSLPETAFTLIVPVRLLHRERAEVNRGRVLLAAFVRDRRAYADRPYAGLGIGIGAELVVRVDAVARTHRNILSRGNPALNSFGAHRRADARAQNVRVNRASAESTVNECVVKGPAAKS